MEHGLFVAVALAFALVLSACVPQSNPWSVQGTIPFDGTLQYKN